MDATDSVRAWRDAVADLRFVTEERERARLVADPADTERTADLWDALEVRLEQRINALAWQALTLAQSPRSAARSTAEPRRESQPRPQ